MKARSVGMLPPRMQRPSNQLELARSETPNRRKDAVSRLLPRGGFERHCCKTSSTRPACRAGAGRRRQRSVPQVARSPTLGPLATNLTLRRTPSRRTFLLLINVDVKTGWARRALARPSKRLVLPDYYWWLCFFALDQSAAAENIQHAGPFLPHLGSMTDNHGPASSYSKREADQRMSGLP